MPLYEYECTGCKHSLEARQKMSDVPLTECPKCGAASLERVVSRSSFALKGSGWYADGYGQAKESKKGEGTSTKSEKTSDSSKSSSTDSSTSSSSDSSSSSGSGSSNSGDQKVSAA